MPVVLALLGALCAALRTRTDLTLENLALRQQLALLRHRSRRQQFGRLDRLLWVWLSDLANVPSEPPRRPRLHGLLRRADSDLPGAPRLRSAAASSPQDRAFNVTDSPTAATAQQIVEAFPDDSAPSYLLRDRTAFTAPSFGDD
jgi:hypothetical protein